MKEAVIVYSVFRNGKIKPLSFMWRNSRIKVDNITLIWDTVEDDGVNIHFSVISGDFYYHLLYTLSISTWFIIDLESTIV